MLCPTRGRETFGKCGPAQGHLELRSAPEAEGVQRSRVMLEGKVFLSQRETWGHSVWGELGLESLPPMPQDAPGLSSLTHWLFAHCPGQTPCDWSSPVRGVGRPVLPTWGDERTDDL